MENKKIKPENRDIYIDPKFLKRRKKVFFITFCIILAACIAIAIHLPSIYRSTATILIEEQQIPSNLIRTTVSGYIEKRLQIITQQIMNRPQLMKIINKFDLYSNLKGKATSDDLINKLRKNIQIIPITTQSNLYGETLSVSNSNNAPTIAFTVSFENPNPEITQEVTNYLASLYIEQNIKDRQSAVKGTTQFLKSQIKTVQQKINKIGQELAQFKQKHLTELPELMSLNLQTLRQMNDELSRLDDQISNLEERKVYLEGQLATIDPYLPIMTEKGVQILTPEKRLELLEDQYLSEAATFSSKYPDVIKLKREIDALKKQVQTKYQLQNNIEKLKTLKSKLISLKGTLSDNYPDVKKLTCEIKLLKKEIDKESKQLQGTYIKRQPDNPSYINIATQIESTKIELKNLEEQRSKLQDKINEYRLRLERTPEVEKRYQELLTAQNNAEQAYQNLNNKLMEATLGEGLENSQHAEHFTLIDPPQYPQKPIKPNRIAIILASFFVALFMGITVAFVKECADRSIHGIKDVTLVTDLPVIGIIPIIQTEEERAKQRRIKLITYIILAILIITLVLAFIHLYVIKLDLLWYKLW